MYNSLAAFFSIFGQNSEGLSSGECGGKPSSGITPFEVFLSQNVPDSSINFLTHNAERESFSIFEPEKHEPDLKRFVEQIPFPAPDNNASNSIKKAPEFLNIILNPAKNAKPGKILPDNQIPVSLSKVSITARSPSLIDIPKISTQPVAFPLNSLTATFVLDGLVHENNPEHLEHFLELELPAGPDAESTGKTLIIPARIVQRVTGDKPVKEINNYEGYFLIDVIQLTQLLKKQFPGEMLKVDDEYTEINSLKPTQDGKEPHIQVKPAPVTIQHDIHLSRMIEDTASNSDENDELKHEFISSNVHNNNGVIGLHVDTDQLMFGSSHKEGSIDAHIIDENKKGHPDVVHHSIINDKEKHEISPAKSGINNSEITENQSVSPKYFIDTGEHHQDTYNTPVITLPISHLVEIAHSSRHEIVIDEILEPESGEAIQLTLRPEDVSQALYKLFDSVIEHPDKNQSGHKVIIGEEIPESEIKEPVGAAFRIYLNVIPHISTQENGANSINSGNHEHISVGSSEKIAPERPAPEDSIVPGYVPKVIEVAKPDYADEKPVLGIDKIAEAISNLLKVNFVSKNGSDFITIELRVHEETLPPVGQLDAVADYFEKWMHGSNSNAEHSSSKFFLNALPEEIVRDIQNIQIEIAFHDTSIPGLHNREVYQDEIIYAGTIKKPEGSIEKYIANTSRVQSRSFGTTPPQNFPVEETPVQFAKSGITQTNKEFIITLKNDEIDLSGEGEKRSVIQEAKNTNSEIKAPEHTGSRIIIEKESLTSLPLQQYSESEEIKIPVKIQVESQTQPRVLGVKTVDEFLSIPPADSENNKTERIVQNNQKPLFPNNSIEPSKQGDIVFKGILETYSDTQNNKHVPENNETIILRIPVKTSQMSIYNLGEAGAIEFAGLHAETVEDEVNVIPEEEHNIIQKPKYKSVHMINKPVPEAVQCPDTVIDEPVRLPKQIPVVIEEQGQEQEGMKIQGMFVLKNPENTKQSAGIQSSESTGEQLNNENRLQQNQGLDNTGYSSGSGKQDVFPEKDANNQTKAQKQIFDIHTEKTISVHKFLEVNAENERSTAPERPLPVWNVDELAEQMLKQAHLSMKKGSSEMRIQLVPPHLGKMLLRIKVENQKMMALIQVETHEARQLIQDNIHQLRESMSERGVDIQKFDVFVQQDYQDYMNHSRWNGYNRYFNRSEQQNYPPGDSTNVPFFTGADPEASGMRLFGYNTMELIA